MQLKRVLKGKSYIIGVNICRKGITYIITFVIQTTYFSYYQNHKMEEILLFRTDTQFKFDRRNNKLNYALNPQ